MNAAAIIDGTMTLEEKLLAIDNAMAAAQVEAKLAGIDVPLDPADLTMCEGCQ